MSIDRHWPYLTNRIAPPPVPLLLLPTTDGVQIAARAPRPFLQLRPASRHAKLVTLSTLYASHQPNMSAR